MAGNNGIPDYSDWDDSDYEEIPWADPAIRAEYEAALGRLILAHNDLDIHLTRLIEQVLRKLGNPPALSKLATGTFAQRLDNLRMLNAISADFRLAGVDYDDLVELNRLRNIVAHGHFQQDVNLGDYVLISNRKTHKEFSTERLNDITGRLAFHALHVSMEVAFYDVKLPPRTARHTSERPLEPSEPPSSIPEAKA